MAEQLAIVLYRLSMLFWVQEHHLVVLYLSENLRCHIKHAEMHYGWWVEAATVYQHHRLLIYIQWQARAELVCR